MQISYGSNMVLLFSSPSKFTFHCIEVQKEKILRLSVLTEEADQNLIEIDPEGMRNYFSTSCITFPGDCVLLAGETLIKQATPGDLLEDHCASRYNFSHSPKALASSMKENEWRWGSAGEKEQMRIFLYNCNCLSEVIDLRRLSELTTAKVKGTCNNSE